MEKKYIYGSEEDKNFFDTEFGNALIGSVCGLGMIICIIVIFLMLVSNVKQANAGELDAWEFNICGINPRDFKDREVLPILGGAVLSLATHELGHVVSAKLMGSDSYFDWSERKAYAGDGYENLSKDQRALYHGAGFLAQTLVGGVLTTIPSTRHSDWTFGFNSFSSVNGFYYAITDGADADSSDTENLDKYGYNGTAIAAGSGIVNGVFTYISLNKDKED
jgi:hypothetical protein